MKTSITLRLPWPPSINHYWRHTKYGHYISQEGKNYRTVVHYACLTHHKRFTADDRLCVHIDAYPPDRRRRDIDNLIKSLLDALQHAHVYPDDNQIDKLSIERHDSLEGRVEVQLAILS